MRGRFWRWASDWRNLATLAASVLVGLLAFTVYDSMQRREEAEAARDALIAQSAENAGLIQSLQEEAAAQRRAIEALTAQVVQLCADRPGCTPVAAAPPTTAAPRGRSTTTTTTTRRPPGPTTTTTGRGTTTTRPPGTTTTSSTSTTQRPNQPVCTTLPVTERCL